MAHDPPFITRVVIENYKSIEYCDVSLGPLTFLVGRNGSGKSNFLDAFRFLAEALRASLDAAMRARGGFETICFRNEEPQSYFRMHVDLSLASGVKAAYGFRIARQEYDGYEVVWEECRIEHDPRGRLPTEFRVKNGRVQMSTIRALAEMMQQGNVSETPRDRLFLVAASGLSEYRLVFDALAEMSFYDPRPEQLRQPQPHDAGTRLAPDGSNVASVLLHMERQQQGYPYRRVHDYLQAIVPTIRDIRVTSLGMYDTLEFRQTWGRNGQGRTLPALSMSDGTLRALALLVALLQSVGEERNRPTLIGIEEPEVSLHPAATAVLLDALREASLSAQVLVTTQSPDLLDNREVEPDWLLGVAEQDGATTVGHLSEGQGSILRDALRTAGELLRTSDLRPLPANAAVRTPDG